MPGASRAKWLRLRRLGCHSHPAHVRCIITKVVNCQQENVPEWWQERQNYGESCWDHNWMQARATNVRFVQREGRHPMRGLGMLQELTDADDLRLLASLG